MGRVNGAYVRPHSRSILSVSLFPPLFTTQHTMADAAQPDVPPPNPPLAKDPTPSASEAKKAAAKAKKKKKDKAKKKAKRSSRKTAPKTKIVVRRLPPNLPEDVFMNAVKRWTSDEVVDYKLYLPGKLSKSKGKEHQFSRAYFHMKTMEAVIAFHQGFDGHIFLDNRGIESRAVVEFAPFQKLPKEHKTPDARQGTIDDDPEFLAFVESLKHEETAKEEENVEGATPLERLENRLAMVTAQTLAAEQAAKPKTTPLLDHIRAQKAAAARAKANKKAAAKANKAAAKENTKGEGGESANKKRRDRNKKKKEEKKVAAAGAGAGEESKSPGGEGKSAESKPKKPRPPKDKAAKEKVAKDKVAKEKTSPKEKTAPKDKPVKSKPAKKEGSKSRQQQQQQPGKVSILGRPNASSSSSNTQTAANKSPAP
ncbi:Smg-4/UPF3 family-domain-containing protein [Syncephalastrum racemosum]|uniref:Smg-4/UPF3 family-domain-containing protein n=1 Tax=Syncephalastrum racemosum TaxID=13706 RepID=A0A1X2HJ60_SYNRA|nr:Smg-4/UPF3 family-domain-containing protein [Syncephalastrum racemosum]